MDTFEVLNNLLVKLFNDILDVEEKAIITDEFKDISVTDMHIIEAVGTEEPRTMTAISKTLGVTMGTLTIGMNALVKKGYIITSLLLTTSIYDSNVCFKDSIFDIIFLSLPISLDKSIVSLAFHKLLSYKL